MDPKTVSITSVTIIILFHLYLCISEDEIEIYHDFPPCNHYIPNKIIKII